MGKRGWSDSIRETERKNKALRSKWKRDWNRQEDAESGRTWCGRQPRERQRDWEEFMSANGNEYTYVKQFEGNLRGIFRSSPCMV